MKKINVLYQSNDSYAPITGVSIFSLLENNKDIDILNIFVLNDGIKEENIMKMKKMCKSYKRDIFFLDTDVIIKKIKDLKLVPYKGTYTTYFKLFVFDEIKTNNDIILQLDGDTIINGSLAELCDFNFNGNIMAATYDCIVNDYKKMVDIPLNEPYYNCGVLLIDQKKWRDYKCKEKIVDHLKNKRNSYFIVDQDIINVLFRKNIAYLDLTYNFNSGFYIYGAKNSINMYKLNKTFFHPLDLIKLRMKQPKINHCMGAMTGRPWELENCHPQNDLFDKYLYKSPWHDYKKIVPKRSTIFKIQKKLYDVLPINIYIYIHRYIQILYYYINNKKVKQNER